MKWTKALNSLLIARIRPGTIPPQGYNRLNREVHITTSTAVVIEVLGFTSRWQFPYLENEADDSIYLTGFQGEFSDIKYVKDFYI